MKTFLAGLLLVLCFSVFGQAPIRRNYFTTNQDPQVAITNNNLITTNVTVYDSITVQSNVTVNNNLTVKGKSTVNIQVTSNLYAVPITNKVLYSDSTGLVSGIPNANGVLTNNGTAFGFGALPALGGIDVAAGSNGVVVTTNGSLRTVSIDPATLPVPAQVWTNDANNVYPSSASVSSLWFVPGGNARGTNTIDLLAKRSANDKVAGATGSTLVGGLDNSIVPGSDYGIVAGGALNFISGSSTYDAIVGGSNNEINNGVSSSIIAGGDHNILYGPRSAIISGGVNSIYGDPANLIAASTDSTIGTNSGYASIIAADTSTINGAVGSDYFSILGGLQNHIVSPSSGFGFILGGRQNEISANHAWAIGDFLTNATASSIDLGFSQTAKVRVDAANLNLIGTMALKQTNGAGAGFVMTSDASGVGSWGAIPAQVWTNDGVIRPIGFVVQTIQEADSTNNLYGVSEFEVGQSKTWTFNWGSIYNVANAVASLITGFGDSSNSVDGATSSSFTVQANGFNNNSTITSYANNGNGNDPINYCRTIWDDGAHDLLTLLASPSQLFIEATTNSVSVMSLDRNGLVSANGYTDASLTSGELVAAMGSPPRLVSTNSVPGSIITGTLTNNTTGSSGTNTGTVVESQVVNLVGDLSSKVSTNDQRTLAFAGPIYDTNLTASTIVHADANKGFTSLANGAGALTNDNAGNFGWYGSYATQPGNNNWSGSNYHSGAVTTSTNLCAQAPDFSVQESLFSTNAAFAFLAPIGVDTTGKTAQWTLCHTTNTTASAVAITVPAGVRAVGTMYVTNLTEIWWNCYGGRFTNAFFIPVF